ncbi:MAG: divergent polysaccharide deacetylase family protein [Elusimicrobia bacterium]|nr:divergent polysaccharide deacetylase family protein [Elusimicrobiota bacterium]
MNKSGGGVYRFLTFFFAAAFLVTLTFFIVFFIKPVAKKSPKDLTAESLKFETVLGRVFSSVGIGLESVIEDVKEEFSVDGREWIKFHKSLSLPENLAEEFFDCYRDEAIKRGLEIYTTRYSSGMEFSASLSGALISGVVINFKPLYRAAIIIDDVGYRTDLEEFVESGGVFTYAILPNISHSLVRAEELRQASIPYILHMPMEPIGYPKINPGSPALLSGMSRKDISDKLDEALKSVPDAPGLNNHMGSAFTADEASVENLMSVLKEKGLFFVDSRTIGKSLAYDSALDAKVPAAENRVFLDNEDDPEYIKERLEVFIKRVLDKGEAVAIGHATKKHTASVIKNFLPRFEEEGIELLPVEELLH